MNKQIFWKAVFESNGARFNFKLRAKRYQFVGALTDMENAHVLATCYDYNAQKYMVFDMSQYNGQQYITIENYV